LLTLSLSLSLSLSISLSLFAGTVVKTEGVKALSFAGTIGQVVRNEGFLGLYAGYVLTVIFLLFSFVSLLFASLSFALAYRFYQSVYVCSSSLWQPLSLSLTFAVFLSSCLLACSPSHLIFSPLLASSFTTWFYL
jgi:hypothetical protein